MAQTQHTTQWTAWDLWLNSFDKEITQLNLPYLLVCTNAFPAIHYSNKWHNISISFYIRNAVGLECGGEWKKDRLGGGRHATSLGKSKSTDSSGTEAVFFVISVINLCFLSLLTTDLCNNTFYFK